MIIGPSTGWLYAKGIYSLSEQEKILRESGANAFELCPASEVKRHESLNKNKFGQFDYRSFHLPDYDASRSLEEQVAIAKNIFFDHKINNALIHPLLIPKEYYERLTLEGISLAIENMDRDKTSGYSLKELEDLIENYNLNFVLDVQHAYEHDVDEKYSLNLFELTKHKIVHLHISGELGDNRHVLVCKANNKAKLVDFIGKVLSEVNVPLILEGEYQTSKELKEEIDFLRDELMSK